MFVTMVTAWNPPHVDSNLVTVTEHVELYDHHFELPVDINQHAFSKYAQIFFKVRKNIIILCVIIIIFVFLLVGVGGLSGMCLSVFIFWLFL